MTICLRLSLSPTGLGPLFCSALALAMAGPVRAQVDQTPSFEVASVRLTDPKTPASERVTDTRVELRRVALRNLLWMAFRIDPFHSADRLSAPDWVAGVVVDVQAVIPSGATREQVPDMVKALLVERFGLRTRVEPRPTDVYELIVGQGGIRMQDAQPGNDLQTKFPVDASRATPSSDVTGETVRGPVRIMFTPMGRRIITDRLMYERNPTARRTVQIDATRMTMTEFASILGSNLGRPVLDGTGLTGLYQFKIELPPDAFVRQVLPRNGASGNAVGTLPDDPTGVSTFKAVEQLGLKLEARRIPMDTIVVEHVERVPREN